MAPLKVDVKAQNSERGEACLPKEICEAIGLADEGVLFADIHEGAIRLRTGQQLIEDVQKRMKELLGENHGLSVDAFLQERREEARREEERGY